MFLNPRRRQAIRFQHDPQAVHAAVESAFAPRHATQQSRTLWRLERREDTLTLLLLSEGIPSLEHIQEQAGWANEMSWESRPYDTFLSRLQIGQQYSFRLTANPTYTVTDHNGVKRKVGHVTSAQQAKWLVDRAENLGVRFLSSDHEQQTIIANTRDDDSSAILVSQREILRFRRSNQQVTLSRAQFDGYAEVVDVAKLRSALMQGVGRGKAYGCGLLTLAPASRS